MIICFTILILYGLLLSFASSRTLTLFILYNLTTSFEKKLAVTLAIFFASIGFVSVTVILIISVLLTALTLILLVNFSYVISRSSSSITCSRTRRDFTISAYVSTRFLLSVNSLCVIWTSLPLRIIVV